MDCEKECFAFAWFEAGEMVSMLLGSCFMMILTIDLKPYKVAILSIIISELFSKKKPTELLNTDIVSLAPDLFFSKFTIFGAQNLAYFGPTKIGRNKCDIFSSMVCKPKDLFLKLEFCDFTAKKMLFDK